MRQFPHFNTGSVCPICGKKDDKPVVLIPIDGTTKDNICEAEQVHADCLHLRIFNTKEGGMVIYQKFDRKSVEGEDKTK